MDTPLRVLIVEDSDKDVALEVRALKAAGYQVTYVVVATATEMKAALAEQAFDIVISDHDLPQFDAPGALAVLKQSGQDIPFIIVSGVIGEELAVALMKAGAHDYVMKDRLARLVPAVQKELKDAEARRERKRAEKKLRESEEKFRWLLDNMADVITVMDMNLRFTYVSPSIMRMRGYTVEEAVAQTLEQVMTPESLQISAKVFEEELTLEASGTADPDRIRIVVVEQYRKGGSIVVMENHLSFLRDEEQKAVGIISVSHDITERRVAEELLRDSRELLSNALEMAHLGHWEYDVANDLFTFNDQFYKIFRTTAEQVGGYTMSSTEYANRFVHPDDMDIVGEENRKAIETTDIDCCRQVEHRMLYADGTVGYIAVRFFIVKDSHGRTVKTYGVNQDITERKLAEEKLRKTLGSLSKALNTTIQVMVSAVEARDPYTAGHQVRVADLARAIATELGLPQEQIAGIHMAGTIHDLGKLSIPAEILSKPTKLSEVEFALIKEHSRSGYEILKDVESPWPLAQVAYQHHERMDGSGYPQHLKGDEILMEARIMAVADVVESMASHRPYRPALGIDAALEEIERNKGILYDDVVAEACLRLFREKGFQLENT